MFDCSLQGLMLLFLDKIDDFGNKNEELYNPSIKNVLAIISAMPHQFFGAGLRRLQYFFSSGLQTSVTSTLKQVIKIVFNEKIWSMVRYMCKH